MSLTLNKLLEAKKLLDEAEDYRDMVMAISIRMPRTKKRRIRKKWRNNPSNWIHKGNYFVNPDGTHEKIKPINVDFLYEKDN